MLSEAVRKDQVDESMQDSFKQTKDLTVVDKIKIFLRQIQGENAVSKYNFLSREKGWRATKIYSQKDPLNVA